MRLVFAKNGEKWDGFRNWKLSPLPLLLQKTKSKGSARMCSWKAIPVLLVVLAVTGAIRAQESTKTFPSLQCRFTLPGQDWSWHETAAFPNATCAARNEDLVFILTVMPVPASIVATEKADESYATNFDQDAYSTGAMKKRGGKITTFKGLSCYESQALVNGELTAVIRIVVANGFAYTLQLLGGTDPVEGRPDFETIMNSFEFTSPPVAAPAVQNPVRSKNSENFAYHMGQIVGACLFAALILALLGKVFGKKWMSF